MSAKTLRRAQQQRDPKILTCYHAGAFVQELRSFLCVHDAPNKDPGAIVRLNENVFGALANWLERTGWIDGLIDRPVMLGQVRGVLDQLADRKHLGDAQDQLERGSLVARYLIGLVSMGVDVSNLQLVQAATLGAADVRLPRYWARPPWLGHNIWRLVTRSDCLRFLADYRWFWSLERRSRRPGVRIRTSHLTNSRFKHARLDLIFRLCNKFVAQSSSATILKMGQSRSTSQTTNGSGHACMLAYCDQILRDYTSLYMGVQLVQRSFSLQDLEIEDPRLLCSLLLSQLSLLYGMTFEDGFKIGFDEQAGAATGWVDVKGGILNLRIGYDPEKALFGRIPPQTVRLPLLSLAGRIIEASRIVERLQLKGKKTLGEFYGPNRLDQVCNDLGDFARLDESSRVRLRRLWEGWQYVASRRVRLQPGVMALLSGTVVGPYRAESSYLTVTEQFLFKAVSQIHSEVFRFAGLDVQFEYESSSPETRVGKCSPTLGEVADSASLTLTNIKRQNDLCAACHWLSLTHGRRPTGELPHPTAHLLATPGGLLIVVG